MAHNSKSRARSGTFTKSPKLSELLEKPNIWSDWMSNKSIGPLAWPRLAALLLRRQTPEGIIDLLAPAIQLAREKVETDILEYAQSAPEEVE